MTLENMKSHLVRFVKQNRSQGFKRTDLYNALQLVETNELEALFFTALDELVTENKIYFHHDQERYYWMAPGWYYGRLKMHPKGYGFVTLTDQNYQLAEEYERLTFFVARDSLTKALDGDAVIIEVPRFTANEKMKPAAILIASIKRYHHFVVGVLKRTYRHKYYLVITNVKLQHYFSHIVNIDEKDWPLNHLYKAQITRVKQQDLTLKLVTDLGHSKARKSTVRAIAASCGADVHFSEQVEEQAQHVPNTVTKAQYEQKRLDLRETCFVTIDGDDSKDFDDAIYVQKLKDDLYCLQVAIADVAEYVKQDSLFDKTAYERGCSVYLLGEVLPMLPASLSNEICSLNPHVDRLALMAEMIFNKNGQMVTSKIKEVIINSHARLTYNQVNRFWKDDAILQDPVKQMLQDAYALFLILQTKKQQDGYVDFELVEPQYVLNSKDQIAKIVTKQRGDAEKMIESFMVAANEAVANLYVVKKQPFLYRNHKHPQPEKISRLCSNLALMDITITIDPNNPTPQVYQEHISLLKDRDDFAILGPLFLRSMEKALYEVHNYGHFGLGSKCYTHFTSPIRRYCDLIVHRTLKAWLHEEKVTDDLKVWEQFEEIALQCNETEMVAFDAENAVIAYRTAEYMAQHIGEQYEAIIVTITNFGFFVELPNRVSGLVHISTLEDDFYEANELKNNLIGQRTKKVYRLGQKVKVEVTQADAQQRKIDFIVVA